MKNKYFFLIAIAVISTVANAQYKLSSGSNAFLIGDKHEFIFVNAVDEGPSGKNVTWDFSGLKPTANALTTNMTATNTLGNTSDLIPQANIIIEEAGSLFFFKVTSNGMEQYGVKNNNTITRFDKPFVKLKFPFAYADKVSGEYSGVTILQNNTENKVSGTYEVIADAFGTLLLPNNITLKNTLRVKQTKTFANSDLNEITYRWYVKGVRYPALVIIRYQSSKQSFISQVALYAHIEKLVNPVKEATIENNTLVLTNVEVYPNPYHDQLTVNFKLENNCKVKIDLLDTNGKLIKSVINKHLDKGYNSVTLAEKTKVGYYFIRIKAGENTITKTVIQE